MVGLPPRSQRHLWLRYQVEGYTKEMVHDFERRLDTIFGRQVLFTSHAWRRLFEIRGPLVKLGVTPSYTLIRDPWRRLCHRLISFSIFGRAQAPEKGRKRGAKMSRGYFIRRLAEHFGLVNDEGLIGLTVIARELPLIDMDELVRLRICDMFDDTWAWVAPGPERQPDAVAGALKDVEGANVGFEGA
ncbi:hypothetical protein Tco_1303461 [Tanacetum coccineum]